MRYLEDQLGAEFLEDLAGLGGIAKVGVWCWVAATQTLTWSKQLYEMLGLDPESYTPTIEAIFATIHPDDRRDTVEGLLAAAREGRSHHAEFRFIRADGAKRIGWAKMRPVMENGLLVKLRGICLDLTYVRRTEATAREREADYRNIIELSPQLPWVADADGKLLSVSSRFAALTGVSADAILAEGWMKLVHPDDLANVLASAEHALATGRPLDHRCRVRCADGTYRWIRRRASPKVNDSGQVTRWYGLSEDIQDQVLAEHELLESENHYRFTVELSNQIPWTADPDGAVSEIGAQWLARIGTTAEQTLGSGWANALHPDDREKTSRLWMQSIATGEPYDCKYRIKLETGDYRWVRARARPRLGAQGQIIRWYGAVEDIQDQVEAEEALLKAEERYRLATRATNDLIWDHDLITKTIEWNACERTAFGYACEDLGSKPGWWKERIHPDDRTRVLSIRRKALAGNETVFVMEYRFKRADGTYAAVVDRGYIVRTPAGPVRAVGAMQDLSERKQAEEQVLWSATHDGLTALPNRRKFNEVLKQALEAATTTSRKVGLLHLDLDHFKQINDSLGHDAGDAILKIFAQRLKSTVRSTDTVARLGGDEFAVIMPGIGDRGDLDRRCDAILDRMREPFTFGGNILDCRASIGASIFPHHGNTPEELLKSADIALYTAKAAGRGVLRLFEAAMRAKMQQRSSMISLARDAVRDESIVPYYQPKVDYRTNLVSGCEALLRWRHRHRGIQLPDTIRAAFEDLELAAAISDRMIEMTIADMRRWIDAGVDFGHVAVNASAADFRRNDFAERLLESLARRSVPTRYFQLEVTETVFLGRGAEYVDRALKLLSSEGVQIALDDFGTGYASLRHLRQFPVNVIKIDQSFVRGVTDNPDDEAIIRAVINLSKSLSISVVAEGIETVAQEQLLRRLGCDVGQGFLYSKAVPAGRLPVLIGHLAQSSAGDHGLRVA